MTSCSDFWNVPWAWVIQNEESFYDCIRQLQCAIVMCSNMSWEIKENNTLLMAFILCPFYCMKQSKCLNLLILYPRECENVPSFISLDPHTPIKCTVLWWECMPIHNHTADPLRSSNLLWPLWGRAECFICWSKDLNLRPGKRKTWRKPWTQDFVKKSKSEVSF